MVALDTTGEARAVAAMTEEQWEEKWEFVLGDFDRIRIVILKDNDYHDDHDDLEDPDYKHNPDHYRLPGASCIAGSMVNEQMDYGEV